MWFYNRYSPNTVLKIKIKKRLFRKKSPYQLIEIFDCHDFGRLLVLDGIVNVSDSDEFIYHEMMTHVPLFSHPHPERVLVIGGGDGGIVRELVKHPAILQIDLVEIDADVITASKKFLSGTASAFDEPRLRVCIEDGSKYVKRYTDTYDLIIIDSPDPVGAGKRLFHKNFYTHCFRALREDGMLCTHAETPTFKEEFFLMKSILLKFNTIFPGVHLFTACVPSYSIGIWCFLLCSKKYHPLDDFQEVRLHRSSMVNRYYNADIHRSSFALPTFLKATVKQ